MVIYFLLNSDKKMRKSVDGDVEEDQFEFEFE